MKWYCKEGFQCRCTAVTVPIVPRKMTSTNIDVISLQYARASGIALRPWTGGFAGIGDTPPDMHLATDTQTFSLPGVEVSDDQVFAIALDGTQECLALAARRAGGGDPPTIDGFLGAPFFRSLVVEIDYAARLAEEVGELEDAEDAQQADGSDDHQRARLRQQQREIRRADGQEVHDSVEAERVAPRPVDGQQPEHVLDGEEGGDDPLHRLEQDAVLAEDLGDALQHHGDDANEDEDEQGHVERHVNMIRRIVWPLQVVAAVVSRKGVAKYQGVHAFRHFYASWCINRRVDGGLELPPKLVQERLGHATITLTSQDTGVTLTTVSDAGGNYELPTIRPGARYFTSLRLLARVKEIDPSMFTKSGLMVGLGESREEILQVDGPDEVDSRYSERMLERVRVAYTLIHDLDVNLEGAAIIVRLREEIADLQGQLGELARRLKG